MFIFPFFSASLCAAGSDDGCTADNVFDSGDCTTFESNGWDAAHVVAGLTNLRTELTSDTSYTKNSEGAFEIWPACSQRICKCQK